MMVFRSVPKKRIFGRRTIKYVCLIAVAGSLLLTGCSSEKKQQKEADLAAITECEALLEAGDYKNALGSLEALKESTQAERAWKGIGMVQMAQEQYEAAIDSFNTALTYAGADAGLLEYDISYYKAACLTRLKKLNDALELYTHLVEYKPETKTYLGRGTVYAKLGNFEMARADYDMATKADPGNYDQYILIYQMLSDAGREDIGLEYLRTALESGKDRSPIANGKMYYYLGQYDRAKTEFEKLKAEENPEVTLYLAKTYEALGDPLYAQGLYLEYLEANPSDGEIANQVAVSMLNNGLAKEALELIQSKLDSVTNGKRDLLFNEVAAYEYLLDFGTARTKALEYLENYPEDAAIKREIIFLNSRVDY